jgi:hypothetical protein
VYISLDASDSVLGSSHDEARETEIVLIIVRPTGPLLLSIYWTTSLLLLVLAPLDLDYTVWAQQEALSQDSIENTTTQIANRLNTIIELLEQARQGSIIQLYITIIVFMMGLAFVIFGLYIGQEQKLSVFTKRLYLIDHDYTRAIRS